MPILIRGSGGKVQKMQSGQAYATNKVSTDSSNYNDYLKITFPFLGNISFYPVTSPRINENGKDIVMCGGDLYTTFFSVNAMRLDNNIGACMVGLSFSRNNEDEFLTATQTGDTLTLQCKTDANTYFTSRYYYFTWSD